MANFTTHVAAGIIGSGVLATLTLAANIVTPGEIMTLVFAGAFGAVLPDIDLGHSRASQAMFAGLGVFIAFVLLFNISYRYSIAEMWIIWIATYVGVRYIGHNVFHHLSRHRGVFHSLLAGLLFAFLTAAFYSKVFGASETLSWLAATFMFAGYLIHLVLDEIYSVDVLNERVKESFGSALKIIDLRYPYATAALAACTIGAFFLTPAYGTFVSVFGSPEVWAYFHDRLLPQDSNWFGLFAHNAPAAAGTATGS